MYNLVLPPASNTKTFRKINMAHVFLCTPCGVCWMAGQLHKTRDGKYVCIRCNGAVQDVTNSPLGRSFLQIVRPRELKQ